LTGNRGQKRRGATGNRPDSNGKNNHEFGDRMGSRFFRKRPMLGHPVKPVSIVVIFGDDRVEIGDAVGEFHEWASWKNAWAFGSRRFSFWIAEFWGKRQSKVRRSKLEWDRMFLSSDRHYCVKLPNFTTKLFARH
jgi:hypothetical protein